MRAVVYTLGCKVNDVESGSIIRGLETLGYTVSRELVEADLYVINTCAVTAEAERKSRQTVGKAIKCNPGAKIIVCGCASEKSPTAFLEKGHTVYAVTGAQRKNKVLEIVENGLEQEWNSETVWCNPPYGREIGKWVHKCFIHAMYGNTAVMLLPARTDTTWFHDWIYNKFEIRFMRGRLKFGNAKNAAPFPSMIVIFRKGNKNEK